jgi:hypothetical protein
VPLLYDRWLAQGGLPATILESGTEVTREYEDVDEGNDCFSFEPEGCDPMVHADLPRLHLRLGRLRRVACM